MRMLSVIVGALLLSVSSGGANAHGGGLDASGCHHDRKRGGYHCHGGGRARAAPVATLFEQAPPRRQSRAARAGRSRGGNKLGGLALASAGGLASFRNCAAARAAGAAPVRAGDPGYGRHLDRDGDGVGCE